MSVFTLKSFQQVLSDLIAKVGADTPLTDITPGSVILTLLEAVATEDANTYIQMLNIIRSFNLDTVTGDDLDDRAYEYGLTRLEADEASGYVTFADSAFSKVQTNIYTGLPGPSAGNTSVNIADATGFSAIGGNVIVGRGTNNVETVPYAAIVNMGTYYRLNLAAPLTKDHGTDETVIYAQGGDRLIPAGTVVYVPESDLTDQINFVLQSDAIILDGEVSVANNLVVCTQMGIVGNVNIGAIRYFSSLPFATATVTNPGAFTNGRDIESDSELRERIRGHIQSLSRGTITALLNAATQVSSAEQNNKVVSTNFVEATTLNELNFLYIDDGNGLEPMFEDEPYQELIEVATGGEKFLQLDNDKTPVMKATLVSLNSEPFGITAGQSLVVRVNGVDETITFGGVDMFAIPGAGTAEEVVVAINNNANYIEARTAEDKTKVAIQAKVDTNEHIQVVGGDANLSLGFKQGVDVYTLKMYKNDVLLSKDGQNAYVISVAEPGGGYALPPLAILRIIVDNVTTNPQTVNFTTETTAQEIRDTINNQIVGAVATVVTTALGNVVKITSTNPISGNSAIQIPGVAPDTANAVLQFPTSIQLGLARDYTLNKYNGQIELEEVLDANDEITIGSDNTRAYLESSLPENALTPTPYDISAIGQTLIVQVDDIVNSTVTGLIDASNFIDVALIATYTVDDYFVGKYVRFTNATVTPALQGIAQQITAYNATTGQLTTSAFPAIPQPADTYEIVQIWTAVAGDIGAYTADQIDDIISIEGVSFYGKQKNLNRYLRIQTNTHNATGQIYIHPASTVPLGIPTGQLATAQQSNYGYLESGNGQDFTFGEGQNILFVIDNDLTYKTIEIDMQVPGTVTTQIDASNFSDISMITSYITANFFLGMLCRFRDTTPTVALRSQIRTISVYNQLTGQFSVSAPFPAIPGVADLFDIIPVTAKNVVDLFNNSNFTNLSTYCDIEQSANGTRVQITSKTRGSAGSVRCAGGTANNFMIPLLTNGTALGQFTCNSIEGLSIGLPLVINDNGAVGATNITITDIVGVVAPYTVTVSVDAGGTDISMYLVGNGAYVEDRNQFEFSLIPSQGIDGYKYYTGLVQECQWVIDGKDTDIINYPGVKAAGVMIEVKAPVVEFVSIWLDVNTSEGVTLNTVMADVKAAVGTYVNNLGIGQDVILSEVVAAVMAIEGITDCTIISPTSNIPIEANELPRILEENIQVG